MRLSMRTASSVINGRPAKIANQAATESRLKLRAAPEKDGGEKRGDKARADNHVCCDLHVITPALSYQRDPPTYPVDAAPT